MNKKRILILISFALVTLSGCSAKYTLKYENDTFIEIVNVSGDTEDQAHPTYEYIKENGYSADVDGREKFTLDDNSYRFDVTLTHKLKNVKLDRLKVVHECFGLNSYKETEDSYYLALYGDYYCKHLEDSTFTLETDDVVTIHNAHRVEDNRYIWDLDEDKVSKDGIKFQIMKSSVDEVKVSGDTMLPLWAKTVILFVILAVSAGIYIIVKRANER